MNVYVVLLPSVLLTDLAAPLDALRYAQQFGTDLTVHLISPSQQVESVFGLQLSGMADLPERLQVGDLLVLPGAMNEQLAYRGAAGRVLIQWLSTCFDPQVHQALCVCSGVFLLAQAGLLNQVKCTTHHELVDELRQWSSGAEVLENRVFVDDGAILSSAGITAGFDLILYWLAQRFGHELALKVARQMNVYFRRMPNDAALSPWLIARNHMQRAVHRVQDAIAHSMIDSPNDTHDLNALANIACVSSRHLTRIFKQHTGMTVHDYQLALRHALFDQWRAQGLSQEKSALCAGFSSVNVWRRSRNNQSIK